jgi:hypothetical protein
MPPTPPISLSLTNTVAESSAAILMTAVIGEPDSSNVLLNENVAG